MLSEETPLPPLDRATLAQELDDSETSLIELQTHFQRTYDNLRLLDATRSKWSVFSRAMDAIEETYRERLAYLQAVKNGE